MIERRLLPLKYVRHHRLLAYEEYVVDIFLHLHHCTQFLVDTLVDFQNLLKLI